MCYRGEFGKVVERDWDMAAIGLNQQSAVGIPPRIAVLTEWWLKGILAFLCFAPSLPETPLKDSYAYVLLLLIALPAVLFHTGLGELNRSFFQFSTVGLLLGLVATWLSAMMTPLKLQPSDWFQLAREFFPVLLAVAAPCVLMKAAPDRREALIQRFCTFFPVAVLVGFALQQVSPFFFEIMQRYYCSQGLSLSSGYMATRPGLTFGNPNVLGLAIALTGIAAATGSGISSTTLALRIGLTGFALLGTGSRTAILAFTAATSCLFLMRTASLIKSILLLGGISLLVFLTCDLSAFTERADFFKERIQNLNALSEREHLWNELLFQTEWRWYSIFGLGPDKERLVVADSGYVLELYRYGFVGLLCHSWWMGMVLMSGLVDRLRRRFSNLAERRFCLMICFSLASYAMAPFCDPRLCSLFFLLLASAVVVPVQAAAGSASPAASKTAPARSRCQYPIPVASPRHAGTSVDRTVKRAA